ncbi:MAG: acyl-CoA dehydrogenase [Planctomycetota bacterium]|nr:MAG: acyl-CoA dehydrogenase [Planctomycetota bacterium]
MAEEKKLASEQEALELAEASREETWENESFLANLFLGKLPLNMVDPFPEGKGLKDADYQAFLEKLQKFVEEEVDPDKIDEDGQISLDIRNKLADLGCFGMKIPKEYGGLGFSQSQYNHALSLIGSVDGNLIALLSAHQSIGVPQPVKLFGTEEQKKKYLPWCAKGGVSGFALTEPHVGSDPANLATTVEEKEDHYLLNGEKLWCTNCTIGELLVVMARHVEDNKISAFIVETQWEGVEIVHRCTFMELKAIENGVIRFKNVKVPKENLLWQKGKGLKLALITLNTGRLSLPAVAVGTAKKCLEIARLWSKERIQWGKPIGKHEAIAHKITRIAAQTFAMEAVSDLATGLLEQGADIRLEAAVGKLYNTDRLWEIADETLQIRGGRGYETVKSLKARGEKPFPVERILRDNRINRIFEGSNEILHLFIAREAVDPHFQLGKVFLDPKAGLFQKLAALPKLAWFYSRWYPSLFLGWSFWPRFSEYGILAKHMRYIHRKTRKMARQIFHGMVLYGPKLQNKQAFLFRIVDIGVELFAMTATITKARRMATQGNTKALELADIFCYESRKKVDRLFVDLWKNRDNDEYKLAQKIMDNEFLWEEEGIIPYREQKEKQKEDQEAKKESAEKEEVK